MSQTLNATSYDLTKGVQEQAYIDALETQLKAISKVTLSAAAEAANAIVVTGAVTDLFGKAVTAAVRVTVTSIPVTANQGAITVVSGTEQSKQNPATGDSVATILTTAAGAFSFSIANTAVEKNSVNVTVDNGLGAVAVLQFA